MKEKNKYYVTDKIPAEWRLVKLNEFIELIASNVDKKKRKNQPTVLLCNYMDVYNNEYITDNISFMEASASNTEIEKFSIKENDVIITKDSETKDDIANSSAVIKTMSNVLCGYHLALLRPKKQAFNNIYLSKLFNIRPVYSQLVNKANGTTRFGLTTGTIENLIIPKPPLPEQQKIASILSTVDEKIENTDRQIEQTQNLKKGLMQRLLTRGIGHARFVSSPLGEIPESWEVDNLKSLLKYNPEYGASASSIEMKDNCYRYIRITDITENGKLIEENKVGILKEKGEKYLLNEDDILIARTGNSVGKSYIHNKKYGKCSFAGYLIRFIIDNRKYTPKLLFYFLHSPYYYKWVKNTLRTGAQPNINSKEYQSMLIPIPPLQEQQKIASILSTFDEKLENLQSKKSQYEQLKKGLMQKLLTGKMRVKVKENNT